VYGCCLSTGRAHSGGNAAPHIVTMLKAEAALSIVTIFHIVTMFKAEAVRRTKWRSPPQRERAFYSRAPADRRTCSLNIGGGSHFPEPPLGFGREGAGARSVGGSSGWGTWHQ